MPTPRTPVRLKVLAEPNTDPAKNLSMGIGTPTPPTWLPREARAEWRRIVAVCSKHPTWLQHTDRAVLTAYCLAWSVYREAAESLVRDGVLIPGRSPSNGARRGLVKNPAVQIVRDSGEQVRRFARELAFSPDSRQRIAIGPSEEDDGDDLFDF